jgi:hypothetical protein
MQTDVENRPPYVEWKIVAVEDRAKLLSEGHYASKDIHIAVIMRPGSKDRLEKEATVWLSEMAVKARKDEIPSHWYPAFKASYDAWLKGEEVPLVGTALKTWPVLSPAQQKNLISMGLYTVEDLAQLPDSELQILGVGALDLRQKARSWLDASSDKGKIVAENAALKLKVDEQGKQIAEMLVSLQALKEQLPKAEKK